MQQRSEALAADGLDIPQSASMAGTSSDTPSLIDSRAFLDRLQLETERTSRSNDSTLSGFHRAMHDCHQGMTAGRTHEACPYSSINHYAKSVKYDLTGMVDDNRNNLPRTTAEFFSCSNNSLLQRLVSPSRQAMLPTRKQYTVVERMKQESQSLLAVMNSSQLRWLRCIKPDELDTDGASQSWNQDCVGDQLTAGGINLALDAMRRGFTDQMKITDFVKR